MLPTSTFFDETINSFASGQVTAFSQRRTFRFLFHVPGCNVRI